MMPVSSPTPVPIHDVLPVVSYFPYPMWMVGLAALVLLGLIGFAIWFFFFKRRPDRVITASERAMKRIAALRATMDQTDAYPFSIEVSEVLRQYIEESQGLAATKQTTREFLDAVRRRTTFNDAQLERLAQFLELADMIKFARMHAGQAECRELLASAECLIREAANPIQEVAK